MSNKNRNKKLKITKVQYSSFGRLSEAETSCKEDVPYPEIVLHNGQVCEKTKGKDGDDDYKFVSARIEVKEVQIDRETKRHWMLVDFDGPGGPGQVRIERRHLTYSALLNYQEVGFPANQENVKKVLRHLQNQEMLAEKVYLHTHLGWGEDEGDLVFYHDVSHGPGDKSKYNGNLSVAPRGDGQKWLDAINKYVVGRPTLELALSCGLSALVVGLIGKQVGLPSLFIHAYGDSSQGKTTAAMLAVSPFGSPDPLVTGLHASWNSTDNALLSRLIGNRGVPVALDESSTDPARDFTALIYRLAGGRDKGRLDRDSRLQEQGTWSTTIFSTGEASLLALAKRNTGLRMRLLEFGNLQWTESAAQADALRAAILEHHGHAGPQFADRLRQLGREHVASEFWRTHKEALQRLKDVGIDDTYVHRGAFKISMILTTAGLVSPLLGIPLDLEGLWALALETERSSAEERNLAERAHAYLLEQLSVHESKFEWCMVSGKRTENTRGNRSIELWGRVTKKGSSMEVAILRTVLDKLLQDGGFSDTDVVLEGWKRSKLLDHEEGRLTRQRSVGGVRHRVYVVRFPGAAGIDDDERRPKRKWLGRKQPLQELDEDLGL